MYGLFLLLLSGRHCLAYGFDSGEGGACGRQYRSGKMHRPPCDLAGGYCTSAGTSYPWHAVKRFVRENQGLMRRMYGDQRHGQVLRAELEDEAAEFGRFEDRTMYAKQEYHFNLDNELGRETEPRFLKEDDISNDDVLNTKFVYSEEPSVSIKLADLRTAPHFRPATHKTTTEPASTTEEIVTETESSTIELTTDTTTNQNVKTETSTNSDPTEPSPGTTQDKPGEVLFQDMEEPSRNKVQINYQIKGVNACPVKEEVVAPFWANNTRGEVLALLNMYPFEQYVHWEKCTHEHRQMYCRDGCRCEQQYRLHRLLAYDPNNECRGIFSDWFRFPSCCVCKCYSVPPAEFRVTSRSPRAYDQFQGLPDWYRRKNEAIFDVEDNG